MSFQTTFKYSINFFTSSAQSNRTTTFVRMTFGRQTSIQTDTFDPLFIMFCWLIDRVMAVLAKWFLTKRRGA
jgi:hypothetical protein